MEAEYLNPFYIYMEMPRVKMEGTLSEGLEIGYRSGLTVKFPGTADGLDCRPGL